MAKREPKKIVYDLTVQKGELKTIGGSKSDDLNMFLVNQAVNAIRTKGLDAAGLTKLGPTTIAMMIGIAPTDELEGMLAAQLFAAHNAAMECYRRAMVPDFGFELRQGNLSQANKLSRTYATLLEALNRHRGKGAQKVTVEHVHVHEGGQAIVGNVLHPGGGGSAKSEDQPHASKPRPVAYEPGAEMPSQVEAKREAVPSGGDEG